MKEKLRKDLEKIFIENSEIKGDYLDKVTKHIISRRKNLINSLKSYTLNYICNP